MTAECIITTDRQCSPCTAPSYSDDGLTCKQCDGDGQYNGIDGASSYKLAPAGYKPTTDHAGIEACLKGTFSDDGVSCKECSGDGAYSDTTGAFYCKSAPAGFKPTSDRKDIVACPAGEFSIGGATNCASCPAGKFSIYNPSTGAVGCTPCNLGMTSSVGSSSCTPCQPPTFSDDGLTCKPCNDEGQYKDKRGASFCKMAPAGTKPSANRTTIELCPKNYFSIGANNSCTACPDGDHSKPGSFACKKSSTGKYYNETANECGTCPMNTFTLSGATDINGCMPCQNAGEYAKPGSGYCKKCSTGEYYDETANACGDCPRNTYTLSGAIGIDGCDPCQNAGEYAEPGSGYCEKCPQYEEFDDLTEGCACMTSFDRIGETCTCKAGYTLMGTSCQPCELGKWKNESGVTSCSRCEATLKGAITNSVGSKNESS